MLVIIIFASISSLRAYELSCNWSIRATIISKKAPGPLISVRKKPRPKDTEIPPAQTGMKTTLGMNESICWAVLAPCLVGDSKQKVFRCGDNCWYTSSMLHSKHQESDFRHRSGCFGSHLHAKRQFLAIQFSKKSLKKEVYPSV